MRGSRHILLTDHRCGLSFDPVVRDLSTSSLSQRCSRFRSEPFVALLLLFTLALSLHLQLARYDNFAAFPARHVLHGDLRPDGDHAGQVFAEADRVATAPALAIALLTLITALSRLISSSVLPSSEPSVREFLNYLAVLVRPPPLLH